MYLTSRHVASTAAVAVICSDCTGGCLDACKGVCLSQCMVTCAIDIGMM
ncbi:MAG: hypothetical protein K6T75_09225 [Acetobacteraceae bacterium]|nr:hypothetical protein [Acetobacteraceae bacterium]